MANVELPTAPTRDRKIEVAVVARRCVYLNNHRIAGSKPYVSEGLPSHTLKTTLGDVLDAFTEKEIRAALREAKARRDYKCADVANMAMMVADVCGQLDASAIEARTATDSEAGVVHEHAASRSEETPKTHPPDHRRQTLANVELLQLAERCENAKPAEEYGLLREAFHAVNGFHPGGRDGGAREWENTCVHFYGLLDAGGFIDAAMTLVPEGWDWARDIDCIFCLYPSESTSPEIGFHPDSPALALCAAALRARSQ